MSTGFKSREDARKDRELDAARKAGTAPPLTDESGNAINPHIPQYISKAPWYLNHSAPSLKHQRQKEATKTSLETWHKRGVTSKVAIKYRKGACENCGALTHDAKSCVERPRKKGAKFTNSDICPDEYIAENREFGYEAVRDRWAGFDPEAHLAIVDEFQEIEEERAKRKVEQMTQQGPGEDSESRQVFSKCFDSPVMMQKDLKSENFMMLMRHLELQMPIQGLQLEILGSERIQQSISLI
ncbi:bifunctional Pre-mRNA-splicing factor SLU7/Pre-mRNA-splicing factor SLU7 domain [Babesia duncani]|uniref:Pre-mRNA-splicing factor SLU7 n=1 Tax=Babesia duncani TaxID=323732 RepID=A0AAD9UMI5_9APIC|nr:bifunctional Pre-mRNA-splicing factor SLU7/Pre-mRNA-splicing factor SLU7 domain [Babesia duncani]